MKALLFTLLLAMICVADDGQLYFTDKHESKTLLTITADGHIKLNRKDFPDLKPDEFAKKFLDVLENMRAKNLAYSSGCLREEDESLSIKVVK